MGLIIGLITIAVLGVLIWVLAWLFHSAWPRFSTSRYILFLFGIVFISELWPQTAAYWLAQVEAHKYPIIKPQSIFVVNYEHGSGMVGFIGPGYKNPLKFLEIRFLESDRYYNIPKGIYRISYELGPREIYGETGDHMADYQRRRANESKFCKGPLEYTPYTSGVCYKFTPISKPTASCWLYHHEGNTRILLVKLQYESIYLDCGGKISNMYYEAKTNQVGIFSWLGGLWTLVFDDWGKSETWQATSPIGYAYVVEGK